MEMLLFLLFFLLSSKYCKADDFCSCPIQLCSECSDSSTGSWDTSYFSSSFISDWKLDDNSDLTVTLPLYDGGEYNFIVDWGDATNTTIIQTFDEADVTHTYNQTGTYTVVINGTINGFRFNSLGDADKIKQISQWGDLKLGNLGEYFAGCSILDITAKDAPDLSNTTVFTGMFRDALALTFENGEIESWNVSAPI